MRSFFVQTVDFNSAVRLTSAWHVSAIPNCPSASSFFRASNKPGTVRRQKKGRKLEQKV